MSLPKPASHPACLSPCTRIYDCGERHSSHYLRKLNVRKASLDTPALCVDLAVMETNMQAIAAACRAHGVAWRPHAKGHKVPAIAQRELAAGAIGITCAKLGEAEVMAAVGIIDLLIANMIVGPLKIARLVELRRIADPIVCVDHVDQITPLSEAMSREGLSLRTMIEVDIGLRRVGVLPGRAALTLAGQIADSPGLELAGIMGYERSTCSRCLTPMRKPRRFAERSRN